MSGRSAADGRTEPDDLPAVAGGRQEPVEVDTHPTTLNLEIRSLQSAFMARPGARGRGPDG